MDNQSPKTPHPQAELLHAIADGKIIQWRISKDQCDNWEDIAASNALYVVHTYANQSGHEIRIKPETKTGWILIKPPGIRIDDVEGIFETKDQMEEYMKVSPYKDKYVAAIQITYREGEGLD
jgi:hypothetical protein